MELSAQFIEHISPPTPGPDGKAIQIFYRDSSLTGFALRVSSGGTKSYILERRIRGKVKRITLGRCDKMSFEKARSRAKKLIGEVERENAPRIINGKIVDANITLLDAFHIYLEKHDNLNDLTREDYQRSMDGPLQEWQNLPVAIITVSMVVEKHRIFGSKYPARSNNAMRLLRAVLNHVQWRMRAADHHPILNSNPVNVLSNRNLWYPVSKPARRTGINKVNLKKWWQASFRLKKTSSREYLHFLLLSALPYELVSKLRFSDIDFDNKTISIPRPDDTQQTLTLPISKYLSDSLYKRPERIFNDNYYIFPGLSKDKPIKNPSTTIKKLRTLSGVQFNIRDLFKTFISLAMQSQHSKSDIHLIKKIYNGHYPNLTDEEINVFRGIQERVALTVYFIING